MNPARSLLRLCIFFLASTALADPENFLLSDFTFVRPPQWQWIPNKVLGFSTVVLKITGTNTNDTAQVVLVHYEPDNAMGKRTAALRRWEAQFVDPQIETNQVGVGTHLILYAGIKGARKPEKPDGNEQPDSALIGAVIEDPKGNIVIKMTGSQWLTQQCKTDFKKMIESAFQPE